MKNTKWVFVFCFSIAFLLLNGEVKAVGNGVELIKNGNFELGETSDWNLSSCSTGKIIKKMPGMSGEWFANFEYNLTNIYQKVELPKDKKITLSFDYKYKKGNGDGRTLVYLFYFDYATVQYKPFYVLKLSDLNEGDDTNNLVKHFSLDISKFAGNKVELVVDFEGLGDNVFSIDNVSILAEDKNFPTYFNMNSVFLKQMNSNVVIQKKK